MAAGGEALVGGEDCGGEDLLAKRAGDEDEMVEMAEAWREMFSVARGRAANVWEGGTEGCDWSC